MPQTLIVVDKDNKEAGFADYRECHSGKGVHHRGFVTLLFNSKNQVLLQKRKHSLFNGFWDLTAISHPLHLTESDESWQEASDRALKKEMGIGHVEIDNIGAFNYFAKDGKNCENEHCAVLAGMYDGVYKANPVEVYESRWVDYNNFVKDIENTPQKYTPWARLAVKQLKNCDFGNSQEAELKKFLKIFAAYKKDYFSRKKKSDKELKVALDFWQDLEGFMEGGKNLRGFLVYLGYLAAGGTDIKKILPVCMAYEIVHSFLLIHDDVIDKSDLRRGKPAIHKIYAKKHGEHFGESMAIVWGDIAAFESVCLVNSVDFDENLRQKALHFFAGTIIRTGYGEALDVKYSYHGANIDNIRQVADLKTARYSFVGPLTLGLLLGGGTKSQIDAIGKFGLSAGIAYQLKDDILGVFGDEKVLGKSILSDMREGKNTLIIHKARQLASPKGLAEINRIWGNPKSGEKELQRIKDFVKKCGALVWCEAENKRLTVVAKKEIGKLTRDPKLQQILSQIADYVMSRER